MKTILTCLAWIILIPISWSTLVGQTATQPPSALWTVKSNLLSPIWKNATIEVEFMPWERVSLFAGAGTRRAIEDILYMTADRYTRDRGIGLAAGGKYFFVLERKGIRTLNGIAAFASANYTKTDQVEPNQPSVALFKMNTLGLNVGLAARKTFLERLVVEAQAGIGYARQLVSFNKEPEYSMGFVCRFGGPQWRSRLVLPVGLNVGVVF